MSHQILGPNDPPAVSVDTLGINPYLVVCDHASNRVPASLNQLGLPDDVFGAHVAYDIGSVSVARRLAGRLGASLVMSAYSRLIIDLNRFPGHPSSIPVVSDEILIPGNQALSDDEAQQREGEFFHPYHNAIAKRLLHMQQIHSAPTIISVHTFTPDFAGSKRPWHVGILWGEDGRIARPLIERLARNPELCVGDNQPYDAREPIGYTMTVHGARTALPHVLLEIRQDLVATPYAALQWADLLYDALIDVFEQSSTYSSAAMS